MEEAQPGAARARWTGLVAPACVLVAAGIALTALLRRFSESASPLDEAQAIMVPATALAVLLAAGALLLLARQLAGTWSRPLARLAAGMALALAIVVLAVHLRVDPVLAALPADAWWAHLPGPLTATGLALAGLGLLALATGRPAMLRLGDALAAAMLALALLGLVGHVHGEELLYGANSRGATGLSTVFALAALAVGMLFLDPRRGVAAVAASPSAGGRLLRRLVPVVVLAPVALGWAALALEDAGWMPAGPAAALPAVLLIVVLAGMGVRQSVVLHRLDSERERLLAAETTSREQVTRLLERITDAFFAVDAAWRFTYINHEAERLLQRRRGDLMGRHLWTEFPESANAVFQRHYQRAMERQEAAQFEACYEALGIWLDVRAYPSRDGLSVFFHDITEQRRAEQALRESEERHRLLADMIPQHIWITDHTGAHVWFSRRWYEFTGVDLEASKGHGWSQLLHPDDLERTRLRWQHSLETGEPYAIEYRFRGADGEYHWFLGQAMPLRDDGGRIVEWFGTLTDISGRKHMEEERERLLRREQEARVEAERGREALERVTESRASLMRGFGHDVKNSLGTAQLHAELLERALAREQLLPRQQHGVRVIRRSLRAALQLIDDLLALAQAEAGQLTLACAPTDAAELVREVAEDARQQAAAAQMRLELHAPAPLMVSADPARLRQILGNLVSNAIKYAPRGRLAIETGLRTSGGPRPGRWVAISVTDSGPGIPADKHELVFQEYARLDPDAAPGFGIGLAISRRYARLMGGDISLDSEAGKGASFTVWLPPAEAGGEGLDAASAA